jgi:CheY-like chemotaxis protein
VAKIFIVDDELVRAQTAELYLKDTGHEIVGCSARQLEELSDLVIRKVETGSGFFDILLLDVQFADHELGGVVLYRKLEQAGLSRRFHHVLLLTRHVATGSPEVRRILKEFMGDVGSPIANLLPREALEDGRLLARIEAILSRSE